ncbi:MAG TPA: 4'-phosphopantetheinyl transferase superfamily protein [Mucilaginibacter sp.]
MISAGNDIVCLSTINAARTNQYKFYSKILSDAEFPLYNEFSLAGIPFEIFVWLLWSVKESAYKFLQRHQPGLIFTPVKFVVTSLQLPAGLQLTSFGLPQLTGSGFDSTVAGIVNYDSFCLHSRSLLYNELIATVINGDSHFNHITWGIKVVDSDDTEKQSLEVRSFLIESIKEVFGEGNFRVDKNVHGCPVLVKNGEEMDVPVSLSHHEGFVGYSFPLPVL